MEPWSLEWKKAKLAALAEMWRDCESCDLCQTRTNVVFGEGSADADILFIGEAPGRDEDESGIPFYGESGGLYNAILQAAGIVRDDQFTTNLIACRPPGNRDPQLAEKKSCWPRLNEIIYLVDPLVIVPIGAQALKALARGRDWGIKENAGELFSSPSPAFFSPTDRNGLEIQGRLFPRKGDDKREYCLTYDMIPVVHPAYILREDGWDPKKKAFPPNGYAVKTVKTLRRVVQYVELLKSRRSDSRFAIP